MQSNSSILSNPIEPTIHLSLRVLTGANQNTTDASSNKNHEFNAVLFVELLGGLAAILALFYFMWRCCQSELGEKTRKFFGEFELQCAQGVDKFICQGGFTTKEPYVNCYKSVISFFSKESLIRFFSCVKESDEDAKAKKMENVFGENGEKMTASASNSTIQADQDTKGVKNPLNRELSSSVFFPEQNNELISEDVGNPADNDPKQWKNFTDGLIT